VNADSAPELGAGPGDQHYQAGKAMAPLQLPEATGGNGAITYSLEPSSWNGLAFDAATRQIAGTPTSVDDASFTYTATDTDGDSDSTIFTITVTAGGQPPTDPAPELGEGPGDQTYPAGEAIEPLQLPLATGGDPPVVA